jgi:N6-adenosine-specific RNA methylase IME4
VNKKYQIILADVPWSYNDKKGNDPAMGGITYPTMELDEVKSLPVGNIADKDCALALWATMPLLREALDVIEAWGFKYTTCLFNWIKLNPGGKGIYSGLGHWVNGNAELCLFGKKGHPKRYEKNVKQIQFFPRQRHSAKPPEIRNEIIRVFGDLPRVELFARQKAEGWDAIGFDIDGRDIREVLNETD